MTKLLCIICNQTRNLFTCYLFVCLLWGVLAALPGCLFCELTTQLNISDIAVTRFFLSRSIAFCVASIITAYILDKFSAAHRYSSFVSLLALVSLSLVAFINFISGQYSLWISMGFAHGMIAVALPVYVFRAFIDNVQTIWFILLVCYGVTKTVLPLVIRLSIVLLGGFSYALFIASLGGIAASVMLFVVATPREDKLRAMEKQIGAIQTRRHAESVLVEMEEHRALRNTIVVLFTVAMVLYFIIQIGLVTFVTVYVCEYLHGPTIVGNSLISVYYGAQLLYRFIMGFCLCDCVKDHMHNSNYLFGYLMAGYAIEVALFMMWIWYTVLANTMNVAVAIPILFIVFGSTGFLASATYPTVYELCETVYPIDGLVSSGFTLAQGIGDLVVVLIMRMIMRNFHIGYLPVPLMFVAVIQVILLFIIRALYNKYKLYEIDILDCDIVKVKTDGDKQPDQHKS